jgi:DnaJ like chaperone protein
MTRFWGTIGGGSVGLVLGGPLGALLGALAGHMLVDREGALLGPVPKDMIFTTGLVALAAKMAKSDGVVTHSEKDAFHAIIALEEEDKPRINALFDLAKSTSAGFESYAEQLRSIIGNEPKLLEDVMDGLFHIAKADGAVHEAELTYLKNVAFVLGIPSKDFDTITARHVSLADDPYRVLGVDRSMSFEDIKAHYRTLMRDNHPDREIARGLPPEAIKIATERVASLNTAWEKIKSLEKN